MATPSGGLKSARVSRGCSAGIFSNSPACHMFDLSGKTAVVVGGTSGIGLTLAKGLARAGANVVPSGRRSELVQAAACEIRALGRESLACTADVASRDSLQLLLDAVLKE